MIDTAPTKITPGSLDVGQKPETKAKPPDSDAKKFEKAKNQVRKLSSGIQEAFKKLLNPSTEKDLAPEQAELLVLEKELQFVEQKAESKLYEEAQTPLETFPLNEQIRQLEKDLGIESEGQKVLEASLLIDQKFLKTAILAGNEKNAYRMFGDDAWTDWLDARLHAKSHKKDILTPTLIQELHKKLAKRTNAAIAGKLRSVRLIGGDYKNLGKPVTYPKEQLQALRENPQLGFVETGRGENTGLIEYPHIDTKKDYGMTEGAKVWFQTTGKDNPALVESMLVDIAVWYNRTQAEPHDPYQLAAELQRKIISTHPFRDINGRLSRLLMNWSLEKDGLPPAILDEPSNDILTSSKSWTEEVRRGSERFGEFEKRQQDLEKIGYHNIAEMMGLSEAQTFYDLVYKQIKKAPEIGQNGELMNHADYEEFLNAFDKEFNYFNFHTSTTRETYCPDRWGRKEFPLGLKQGGLIPRSFIDLSSLKPKDAQTYDEYMRQWFFSQTPVYRAGMCTDTISEVDLVRMFEEPVGIGTGYRALSQTYISPMSIRSVPRNALSESMNYYNQLVADKFLGGYLYLESKNTHSVDADIAEVLEAHKAAKKPDMFNSPFVSTSLSFQQSAPFTDPKVVVLSSGASKEDMKRFRHSFMITSKAVQEGGILGFGLGVSNITDIPMLNGLTFKYSDELELLAPGGILPSAIDKVVVSDFDFSKEAPKTGGMTAVRKIRPDGEFLEVKNTRGEQPETKFYKRNPQTGKFELQTSSQA